MQFEISSLLVGFFSGVVLIGCILYYVKRAAPLPKKVRGYLDLIPSLTEDQRQKVENIREGFLPKVSRIRDELRSKRRILADLLFSGEVDRTVISRTMEEIAELQIKLEEEVMDHILEEKVLLTPEQQKQFYQIITEQFRGGGLGVHGVGSRWEKDRG